MIDPDHPSLSIVRQCALVSIARSTFYREPVPETAANLGLMRQIDEQFLETPCYGSRQMTCVGLAAIYQRPRTNVPHPEHRIYPYLLRDLTIDQPDQV